MNDFVELLNFLQMLADFVYMLNRNSKNYRENLFGTDKEKNRYYLTDFGIYNMVNKLIYISGFMCYYASKFVVYGDTEFN